MRSTSLVVLLFLFSAHVFAHDWMITPIPRGGVPDAQTVSPCEPIKPTSAVNVYTIGDDLTVTWGNGHKSSNHILSIAPFGEDTTVASFTVLETVPASQTAQPQVYELPAKDLANLKAGEQYTFRWSWSGYDNCATLKVANPAPANAVPAASVNMTINPVTKGALVDGDYIIVQNTKPVGVYNVYSGSTTCMTGYTAQGDNCVAVPANNINGGGDSPDDGGMTPGGKAALSLFILALIGVAAFAAFSYFKKGDALFYVRRFMPKKAAPANDQRAADTSYVAYVA